MKEKILKDANLCTINNLQLTHLLITMPTIRTSRKSKIHICRYLIFIQYKIFYYVSRYIDLFYLISHVMFKTNFCARLRPHQFRNQKYLTRRIISALETVNKQIAYTCVILFLFRSKEVEILCPSTGPKLPCHQFSAKAVQPLLSYKPYN